MVGTEAAAEQGAKLLKVFRNKNLPVFHVRHVFVGENAPFFAENSNGVQFHPLFEPKEGETVITKHEINSFRGTTDLHAQLQAQGIERLLIIGAMSHMCIDAATRAAADLGYQCHVAHDARDTRFGIWRQNRGCGRCACGVYVGIGVCLCQCGYCGLFGKIGLMIGLI